MGRCYKHTRWRRTHTLPLSFLFLHEGRNGSDLAKVHQLKQWVFVEICRFKSDLSGWISFDSFESCANHCLFWMEKTYFSWSGFQVSNCSLRSAVITAPKGTAKASSFSYMVFALIKIFKKKKKQTTSTCLCLNMLEFDNSLHNYVVFWWNHSNVRVLEL